MIQTTALSLLIFWTALLLPADSIQAVRRTSAWDYLFEIVMIPGISGQEGQVMDYIQSRLPSGLAAKRDAKNNLWFTAGKDRPHLLFIAHADELGFTVGEVTSNGTVKLKGRGGFLPMVCEARPFVIHTAKGPVDGIVVPRPDFYSKDPRPFGPEAYELDVGASSDAEARELGIAAGDQVIFKKTIVELAPGIIATRAVDDRAGCAALLAAAAEVNWSGLKDRTITFAWSVEEEIGLNGARAMAEVIKPDYVFAVDTFVSTDSPLESRRFGYARLGQGAVLRAIDSSNITPQALVRRVAEFAEQKKIPIQARNSRGGNDGSVFVAGGAADIPLSWPGAYAHSFIEKIDRQDLDALTALIKVLVADFE